MLLEGRVWKDKKHWLIKLPTLDLMTQGKSRKQAFFMLKDAISLLADRKQLKCSFHELDKNRFCLESKDDNLFFALLLKRQRTKNHLTIQEVVTRLGLKSKNAYAQYEQGKCQPSLSKVQEFLSAMNPKAGISLNIIED